MKQVSYRAHSKRSNGATHTHETSLKDKLSKTTTRHLASKDSSDFVGMVILPESCKEEERVHEEDEATKTNQA